MNDRQINEARWLARKAESDADGLDSLIFPIARACNFRVPRNLITVGARHA